MMFQTWGSSPKASEKRVAFQNFQFPTELPQERSKEKDAAAKMEMDKQRAEAARYTTVCQKCIVQNASVMRIHYFHHTGLEMLDETW